MGGWEDGRFWGFMGMGFMEMVVGVRSEWELRGLLF